MQIQNENERLNGLAKGQAEVERLRAFLSTLFACSTLTGWTATSLLTRRTGVVRFPLITTACPPASVS
ncbi:MAG TPA: hypothetical protein PLD47_07975 [Aggregatilineales bacterium]|nr:hypothetical protein [Anaerolineales bacterium]HRE47646.1 hypothetical protein [Aggregatilineales bacterium]